MLGIDAAWTAHQQSGIALVQASASGWQCRALAPSYAAFLDLAIGVNWDPKTRARGSEPELADLLMASRTLT